MEKARDRKLAAKNKHNLVTVGLFLLAQWFLSFLMVLLFFGAGILYETIGVSMFVLALMLAQFVRTGYDVLVERASTLFRPLQPQQCSIYDPYFWYHERFWKLWLLSTHLAMFDGTPFKSFIWRLLGVRIGKRVFDDGCYITESTMVSIGDGCTLNSGSIIHVPLTGRWRFQIRLHHHRRRLHTRGQFLRPLRRENGRWRTTRRRCLSHEGRRGSATHAVGGESG